MINNAKDEHLLRYPEEAPLVAKIESDFDISWVRRKRSFNTELSFYILSPKAHVAQLFGFDREVVLAYSSYDTLEPRAMQALDSFFKEVPARGRVDQTAAIVISNAPNAEGWIRDYTLWSSQVRSYAGVTAIDLIRSNDAWYLRNKLSGQLFSRDLFDYTLPLDSDIFFFGRQAAVAEHVDAVRKSENRGLFGLRKTGKTSILFKVQRQCEEAGNFAIYYDAKNPDIYLLNSDGLIDKISQDIALKLSKEIGVSWKKKSTAAGRFASVVSRIPDGVKVCLIFDEIEYITAGSTLAPNWERDFIPFWQTLWSTQSQHRKFSFIIAGVNATVSEVDRVSGVQNPLFGIVKSMYLTGFDKGETRSLINTLGRRMGIKFHETALDYLQSRYGGHPLLIRKTCSQIHTGLQVSNSNRPVEVVSNDVNSGVLDREAEIQFYCRHITSELEEFYPDEYQMLEMLSVDNKVDFIELSNDNDLVSHLKHYGLVDLSDKYDPHLKIPVVKSYIANQWRRKNKVKTAKYIVPEVRRAEYVKGRVESILREMRTAHKRFSERGLIPLYRGGGPEEADRFAALSVVETRDDLAAFLNQANRSLIEPIDIVGSDRGVRGYFFSEVKNTYPKIYKALNRVRSYRNNYLHLELTQVAQNGYSAYVLEDMGGEDPASVLDGWFQVQSSCLDGLLIGLQAELAIYD